MNAIASAMGQWFAAVAAAWNRFWFTPIPPHTLAVVRILTGAMLFYTHLVWSIDFEAFFSQRGWMANVQASDYILSHFHYIQDMRILWALHIAALAVFAMMTAGLFTRVATVLAFVLTTSYINQATLALFGLDHINIMLVMYLMLAPTGNAYSLDAWLWRRRGKPEPSVATNIATRLIQLHMCVIYFFAGISKLAGSTWWNGYAMWQSLANLEYQSLDMTWMADWPRTVAALTHLTVLWEVTYFALVWPRLSRPVVLILAVLLHLGIALFMGMMTFGLIMIVANIAFISPTLTRNVLGRTQSA
jgi:hypothetical protein